MLLLALSFKFRNSILHNETPCNFLKWYNQYDPIPKDVHLHDLIEESKKMDHLLNTMKDLLKTMEEKMCVMEAQLHACEELRAKEIEHFKMLRIMLIGSCVGFFF